MTGELTIEDLEKHSGLSTRTLHYYMQIGLLPGPEKRGKYASYSHEHLDRLDLILILKEMHMPLKEIRKVLDRLTPSEIVHYRDDQEDLLRKIKGVSPAGEDSKVVRKETSALDYIKGLEEAHNIQRNITENRQHIYQDNQFKVFSESFVQAGDEEELEPKPQIWRRIVLDDGVELNIRDTRDKERRYKIDRLLTFARTLFKNKSKGE
jgi:DNA-binding transcriptional MerR regulator